ncbi:hypothetical protein BC829DRAFT_283373 [Chytridium lagenaria]|nr:hypothetical protein BC829DRAFT_283373 [Chytridium lagenaria]
MKFSQSKEEVIRSFCTRLLVVFSSFTLTWMAARPLTPVESYVLQAMTSSPDAELRNSVPRLLHSGRLLGGDDLSSVDAKGVCVADDANKGRWSWPYIIMTRPWWGRAHPDWRMGVEGSCNCC